MNTKRDPLAPYTTFYKQLQQLIGTEGLLSWLSRSDSCKTIEVEAYMPLTINRVWHNKISLAHIGKQHGDVMHDPEVVFEIGDGTAEPISCRHDYTGSYSEVYRYDGAGKKTHVRPAVKKDLKIFCRVWFKNLRDQGFFAQAKLTTKQ